MKIEVYWVVRHSGEGDEAVNWPVAGPFCHQTDAWDAKDAYLAHKPKVTDAVTVRAQVIEVE